jgi:hypothetical protein
MTATLRLPTERRRQLRIGKNTDDEIHSEVDDRKTAHIEVIGRDSHLTSLPIIDVV